MSKDGAKPAYPMEVQTFITGVDKQNAGISSPKIGAVTGKRLDTLFPNIDEITDTFGKLDKQIDVWHYNHHLSLNRTSHQRSRQFWQRMNMIFS